VVLTHALSHYRERDDILRYLDAIGVRRDAVAVPSRTVGWQFLPAEAFLYDLSDPARLRSAMAPSFPLTGPSSQDERVGCGAGPQGMVPPRMLLNFR